MLPRSTLLSALLLVLASCAGSEPGPSAFLYSHGQNWNPRPEAFLHCYDFSCRTTVRTSVTTIELARIEEQFAGGAHDAADERMRIARAIAQWERIVGARTGTAADIGSIRGDNWARPFQHDCIDESFNTTSYLMMMADRGWLRFHRVVYPSSRGFFSAQGLPHHAATIEQNGTGRRFVVDTWFFDNGELPVVMPVEIWEKGWTPERDPRWHETDSNPGSR